MARPDPNAERKEGQPFVYKKGAVLDPNDPGLEKRLVEAGKLNLTQEETAVMLGVARSTLQNHLRDHESARDAYEAGKQLRGATLKAIGMRHASLDPSTWRFLAKNELGMSDDPSKTALHDETTKALAADRGETDSRIIELTAKLIGSEIPNAPAPKVPPAQRPAAKPADAVAGGPQPGGARQEASARAPRVGYQLDPALIEELEKRIKGLEASAVRKAPRKDGQPHTDRTKEPQVDSTANKLKSGHIPPRLPGRLGSK